MLRSPPRHEMCVIFIPMMASAYSFAQLSDIVRSVRHCRCTYADAQL